jgi:hypothetical protein
MPWLRDQPQARPYVAESLWDNPDFIQTGFHISRFITVSVKTKVEQENIKVLYTILGTTSVQINVHT